jgi:ketosteroid isomerase-like protein
MSEESTTPDLVALARRPYEAFSRRDFDVMMSVYGPDTVFEMGLGVLHGSAAIRGFYEEWSRAYEDFEVEVEDACDLGNSVTIAVALIRGRPADSSGFVQFRFAAIATWRDGLIERVTTYTDIEQARAAAERLAEERG